MLLLHDFPVIDVTFRCINFILLILLLVHVYRRYVLPYITMSLLVQHKRQTLLLQQKELLVEMARKVDDKKYQQETIYRTLEERVVLWNKAVADEQEHQVVERHALYARLKQKRHQQSEFLQLYKIGHAIMPEAVHDAQQELKKLFLMTDQGEEYIQRIIATMKENI